MLTTYLTQVRRLLADTNGSFFAQPDPNSELTDYINDARLAVAADTGCTRILLPLGSPGTTLTLKTEFYPFSAVTAQAVLDVMDIYVTVSGERYALSYAPYSQAARSQWRMLVGYVDYPKVFSVYGQSVAVVPLPFQTIQTEWDIVPQIAPLLTDATAETIPAPFQNSIRFYAAAYGFLRLQQTAKAKEMFGFYMNQTRFANTRQSQRRLAHGSQFWSG